MASRRLKSGAEGRELEWGKSKLDIRRYDARLFCAAIPSRDCWRSKRPLEDGEVTPEPCRLNLNRFSAAPEDAELSEPGDLGEAGSFVSAACLARLLADVSSGEDMLDHAKGKTTSPS